jgi:phosphopantetheine--protein transferase-like protein
LQIKPSREVLLYLLSRYLKVPEEKLFLEKKTHGKLFLPECPSFFFSIAHSGNLLALAFSRHPIGIDVEKKRKVRALAVATKFFSEEELAFISSDGTAKIEEKFFQLWTAKEAVLKADGRGITAGLREVFAFIKNREIASLKLDSNFWNINCCSLVRAESAFGNRLEYFAALASSVEPSLIRWHDLDLAVSVDS